MNAREVGSAADAIRLVETRGLEHVKLGLFDIDGVFRGKYVSVAKLKSALEKGFGFCDVVLGWDSSDQLYDNTQVSGWHTGYRDAAVRILPETCRELPGENTVLFLVEFDESAREVCPRNLLRRVCDRARSMGFSPTGSVEFEFFLFDETSHTADEKRYRDLKPISPGYFGYSMLRNSVFSEFYEELLTTCRAMDFPLEGLHTETGPGVLEAAIEHTDALAAADRGALFKTYTKVLAQRRQWMACFMAKWSPDYPGQSGHIHLSLRNDAGDPVFFDSKQDHGMSETMRHFIGGQQALLPELAAMIAPTVNSFTRLIPGFWAPTAATWGIENRTCALRAIFGSATSQRVEYRITAADINPYIAIAAALGSGLWGIENRIEPDAPVQGSAYDQEFGPERALPATLAEASIALGKSEAAAELFGVPFRDHFAATRMWEEREYRKHISDWELKRYFEII